MPAHVQAEIDAMLAASYAGTGPAAVPRVELDCLDRVRITVADPRGGPDRRMTALEALGL